MSIAIAVTDNNIGMRDIYLSIYLSTYIGMRSRSHAAKRQFRAKR